MEKTKSRITCGRYVCYTDDKDTSLNGFYVISSIDDQSINLRKVNDIPYEIVVDKSKITLLDMPRKFSHLLQDKEFLDNFINNICSLRSIEQIEQLRDTLIINERDCPQIKFTNDELTIMIGLKDINNTLLRLKVSIMLFTRIKILLNKSIKCPNCYSHNKLWGKQDGIFGKYNFLCMDCGTPFTNN